MKRAKNFLSLVLAMTIVFSSSLIGFDDKNAFSIKVSALDTSGTCGDGLSYEINSDGVLTIRGNGVIDDEFFKGSAFNTQSKIKSLVIEDGVTGIGNKAFMYCGALVSVTMANSVTSIGVSAFEECKKIQTVVFSENLTSIGEGAFYNCTALTSVELPDSLTSIDTGVFYKCTSLTSVELPDNLTSIGDSVFYSCSFTTITFPSSLKTIGEGAFGSTALEIVTIPNGVTTIGDLAFALCNSLKDVVIPISVTTIGTDAFTSLIKEINIYYAGTELEWQNLYPASSTPTTAKELILHYEASWHKFEIENMYREPTCEYTGLASTVCSVCGEAGGECELDMLDHNFEIYDTVEATCYEKGYIEYRCTNGCSESIYEEIFYAHEFIEDEDYCQLCYKPKYETYSYDDGVGIESCNLNESVLTLPDTINGLPVVAIEYGAFCENNAIEEVVIPDTVEIIYDEAFMNCVNLKKVVFSDNLKEIGYGAFEGCESLEEVVLPDGEIYIGCGAFGFCTGLKTIDFGSGCKSIEDDAFYNCTGLESVIFSDKGVNIFEYIYMYDSIVTTTSQSEFVGTGDVVTIETESFTMEFTCIVRDDVNGDSFCNVLDVSLIELGSNNHRNFDGVYQVAADTNKDNVIDIKDYQAVTNKALQ